MVTKKTKYYKNFFYIFFIVIIVSFFGWIMENTIMLFASKEANNRFLFLPFILPYGLAILFMYYVFGLPNKMKFIKFNLFNENIKSKITSNVLYFIISALITLIGELVVGNLFYHFLNIKLWDYSNHKYHLTPFVCFEFTLVFGLLIYLFMKFIFSPLLSFLKSHIKYKYIVIIDLILGSLLIIDTILMVVLSIITKEAPIHWKIKI